jgi:hypothetical protein
VIPRDYSAIRYSPGVRNWDEVSRGEQAIAMYTHGGQSKASNASRMFVSRMVPQLSKEPPSVVRADRFWIPCENGSRDACASVVVFPALRVLDTQDRNAHRNIFVERPRFSDATGKWLNLASTGPLTVETSYAGRCEHHNLIWS